MLKPIKIGVEIECLVNPDHFDIDAGEYHHGHSVSGLIGWKAESDSSVHCMTNDAFNGEPTEFVSKVVTSRDTFFKLMENFQDYFSRKGNLKLKETLLFNDTCGAHVHFSIGKLKFANRTIWKVFRETRNRFAELMVKSTIKSKKQILKRYYRSYSRRCTRGNYREGRSKEFNFESEWNDKGLEWRSINLTGIETWAEFMELWEIVWNCLMFLEERAQKFTEDRTITVKPKLKESKFKSDKVKSLLRKKDIFSDEEVEIKEEKIFFKDGEPPESKEMVNLRLQHLKNIRSIKKSPNQLAERDVRFAVTRLRSKRALIKFGELYLPDDRGYYYDSEADEYITAEQAMTLDYLSPTPTRILPMFGRGLLTIIIDDCGNKQLQIDESCNFVEPVEPPTYELQPSDPIPTQVLSDLGAQRLTEEAQRLLGPTTRTEPLEITTNV